MSKPHKTLAEERNEEREGGRGRDEGRWERGKKEEKEIKGGGREGGRKKSFKAMCGGTHLQSHHLGSSGR